MDRMKEFKDQSIKDLKALYPQLAKELFEMKNELRTTKKLDKPHLIAKKRRDRARVLTLINQQEAKAAK